MSADTGAPAARLALPEGYTTREAEEGRIAIYSTDIGAWIGELDPYLSNAQEVMRELIDAYEDERSRLEAPVVLDFGTVAEEELVDRKYKSFSELREEELGQIVGDNPRAAALRIRELEIVAGLAEEALRRSGDEATAEVVRAVLEKKPE